MRAHLRNTGLKKHLEKVSCQRKGENKERISEKQRGVYFLGEKKQQCLQGARVTTEGKVSRGEWVWRRDLEIKSKKYVFKFLPCHKMLYVLGGSHFTA